MSVIDLRGELNRRALQPTYTVGVQAYHAGHLNIDMNGISFLMANDMLTQVADEEKEISADVIGLSREGLNYFRRTLITATENLKKTSSFDLQPTREGESLSSFIRPIFRMESGKGYDYWDALREMAKNPAPIPDEYLLFLPEPDSRRPSRDDIIRALVPFKKAQQEALKAGWEEETTAIRIRHNGLSKTGLILH